MLPNVYGLYSLDVEARIAADRLDPSMTLEYYIMISLVLV